ncbi:MAG TPA: hypothetical protein VIC62_03050, partial [Nakamurella sp.]
MRTAKRPSGSRPQPSPESTLLRRTMLRFALQVALSVAVIVVALSGLAVLIVLRSQDAAANSLLRTAASHADDV